MKRNTWISFLVLSAFVTLYSVSGWAAEEKAKLQDLSPSDCVKCHSAQPAQIDASGGRHKTVSCRDCHTGHRPESKNNIPKCNDCHQGKPHFEIQGCLKCHQNPHTPLNISFGTNLTDPCVSCHTGQIKQLRENKSKHTTKGCSTCHDVHRKKPACTQCHKSHSAEIKAADCNKCHAAHMPKNVTYKSDITSNYCAACHQKPNKDLSASKTRHNALSCAYCHQNKHKTVPKCQDCHGDMHPAGIKAKFPKCGNCHKIAHDLNNWTPVPASKPATDASKTKKAN